MRAGIAILGMVKRATASELLISLPHGLTGKVAVDEALDIPAVTSTGKSLGQAMADAFPLGTFVRGVVLEQPASARGTVDMSLAPARVNAGIEPTHLRKTSTLWGRIKASEDHGYLVDCGPPDSAAFLPFTDCDDTNGMGQALQIGGPVFVSVTKVTPKRVLDSGFAAPGSLQLRVDSARDYKLQDKSKLHSWRSLKPGTLLKCKVERVLVNGLWVSFLGHFRATLSVQHLPAPAHAGWKAQYSIGQLVNVRVLWVDALSQTAALSAIPHVVNLRNAPGTGLGDEGKQDARTGDVHDARVLRVDKNRGVLVGWASSAEPNEALPDADLRASLEQYADWGSTAFVPASAVADKPVSDLAGKFLLGSALRVRITGYSPLECMPSATAAPSAVEAAVLSINDVKPGSVMEVAVQAVKDKSVHVRVGRGVLGVITSQHLADAAGPGRTSRAAAARKAALNSESMVSARVLEVQPKKKVVYLTMKPTLLTSPLPAIASYGQAAKYLKDATVDDPAITHGFVTTVRPNGVNVTLYGGVYGLVPADAVAAVGVDASSVESMEAAFPRGSVQQVRIVSVDAQRKRLALSFSVKPVPGETSAAEASRSEAAQPVPECSVKPGELLSGTVASELTAAAGATKELAIALPGAGNVVGLLDMSQASDHPDLSALLARTYTEGAPIRGLLVLRVTKVSRNTLRAKPHIAKVAAQVSGEDAAFVYVAHLSLKTLLLWAAPGGGAAGAAEGARPAVHMPASYEQAKPGQVLAGYVSGHAAYGVFIQGLAGVSALAPKPLCPKHSGELAELYPRGTSVLALVSEVDPASERITVDLRTAAVRKALAEVAPLDEETGPGRVWRLWLQSLLLDEERLASAAPALLADDSASSDGEDDEEEEAEEADMSDDDSEEDDQDAEASQEDSDDDDASAGDDGEQLQHLAVSRVQLPLGTKLDATVQLKQDYGFLLALPNGLPGLLRNEHAEPGLAVGDALVATVIDVDVRKGVVDVAMEQALPSVDVADEDDLPADWHTGDLVTTALVLQRERQYAVVRLPDGALGYLALQDYFQPMSAMNKLHVGATVPARVVRAAGAEAVEGDPTAGLVLLSAAALTRADHKDVRSQSRAQLSAALPALTAEELVPGAVITGLVRFAPQCVLQGVAQHDSEGSEDSEEEEPEVTLRFPQVTDARVSALLPLCEMVDVCPYSGEVRGDGAVFTQKVARGKPLAVKVLAARVSPAQDGKPPRVRLVVTARPADMSLPAGTLASHRRVMEHKGTVGTPLAPAAAPGNEAAYAVETAAVKVKATTSAVSAASPVHMLRADVGLVAGAVAFGVVEGYTASGVRVGLGGGLAGNMHLTEAGDSLESVRALQGDVVGMVLPVVIAAIPKKNRALVLSARLVPAVAAAVAGAAADAGTGTKRSRKSRSKASAVADTGALLAAARTAIAAACTVRVGDIVLASVSRPMTMVHSLEDLVAADAARQAAGGDDAELGELQEVPKRVGASLALRLSPLLGNRHATLDATHCAERDSWTSQPFQHVQHGTLTRVAVLVVPEDLRTPLAVSSRADVLAAAEAGELTVESVAASEAAERAAVSVPGAVVPGFVVDVSRKGCFIRLTRTATARVLLSHLQDGFVKNPAAEFPAGKLVTGRIMEVAADTGRLDMSLRASDVTGQRAAGGAGSGPALSFRHLRTGAAWPARITSVAEFGVFAELLLPAAVAKQLGLDTSSVGPGGMVPTGLRGLAHASNTDAARGEQDKMFAVGELVQAVVLAADAEAGRLSLSLKAKVVRKAPAITSNPSAGLVTTLDSEEEEEESSSEAGSSDGSDAESEDSDDEVPVLAAAEGSSDDELPVVSDDDEEDSEDEAPEAMPSLKHRAMGLAAAAAMDDEQTSSDSDSDSAASDSDAEDEAAEQAEAAAKFSWGQERAGSSDEGSDDEDEAEASGARRKRARAAAAAAVTAAENARVDTDAPATADQHERAVAADPGNSMLWIQYMSWLLSVAELQAAREVGERALKAVRYRDAVEAMNIWGALLNLEAAHGDGASLEAMTSRALAGSSESKVRARLADIFEAQGKLAEADAQLELLCRTDRANLGHWQQWAKFRSRAGDMQACRALLQAARKHLHKKALVGLTQTVALEEFKSVAGNAERGRTLMEGLLSDYPKRLDLWTVWADQEAKAKEYAAARSVLDRASTASTWNMNKLKALMRKWIAFEQEHGTPADVERVQERARELMTSRMM